MTEKKKCAIKFSNPNVGNLEKHIRSCAARNLPLVERDRHKGERGALICGLAPSLKRPATLREIRRYARLGWTIFGIKEAISYLKDKGLPVHYGVNMDPGAQETERVPVYADVTYCIASSCHPALFDHVVGRGGRVNVYHSACGWPNEIWLYKQLYGCGDTIIGGFTVANRALGLSHYMGFKKSVMAGVDFGWREGETYYADIVKAAPLADVFMNDAGAVDGKVWHSRPDLLASAVSVARLIKTGQVRVIGDSLAAALAKHDDEFLDNVATVHKPDGSQEAA